MKLLCIGHSGQVAQSLRERASNHQIQCECVGRPQVDLTLPDSLDALFEQSLPDVVVNAAAYTSVDAAEDDPTSAHAVNAEGATALAEKCAARNIPFVHLSTDYVFDGALGGAYAETNQPAPSGVYGASKLAGELGVREIAPKHVILRTSWIYSPFGSNFVKTMLRLARQKGAASVVDDQIGNPTNGLDIADTVLAIAQTLCTEPDPDHLGTFHYAGRGDASWADVAAVVFDLYEQRTGCKIKLKRIPSSDYPTPAQRPLNSRLSTQKIERIYGIRPRNWTMGVKDTVNRLMSEGL